MPKSKKSEPSPHFLEGPQRLNKVLAAAGLGSRRQVEELIEQGRVEVDGKVCDEFHIKVDPSTTKISVDGVSLKKQRPVYFAVNKPAGVLCTNRDPEGRPRVIDLVPPVARLFPVGRLDSSSLGLILLTNDGELTQRLAHPKYSVAKTYFVVVQGQIGYEELARLRRGIYLAEGVARVEGAKIRRVRKGCTEIDITLTEGKNREIRRVLARLGHKVLVLRRVAIGPLRLADLPEGAYRPLQTSEVAALYRAAEEARLAKKLAKQKGEPEEKEEGREEVKGKKGIAKGSEKKSKDGPIRSASPTKKTKAPKRRDSLDDDDLLVDRFDDEEGAIEDDDDLIPGAMDDDDDDRFESPDRSFDDAEGFDPRNMIEVTPKWNDDALPLGSVRGGVIDYEDDAPSEMTEESDAERAERSENNRVIKKRPKGSAKKASEERARSRNSGESRGGKGSAFKSKGSLSASSDRSARGDRSSRSDLGPRSEPGARGNRTAKASRRSEASSSESRSTSSERPKFMGKRSSSTSGKSDYAGRSKSSERGSSDGNREGRVAKGRPSSARPSTTRSFKGKKGASGSRQGGYSGGSSRGGGSAKRGGPKKGGSNRGSSGGKRGR